jgi:hypothetical protein
MKKHSSILLLTLAAGLTLPAITSAQTRLVGSTAVKVSPKKPAKKLELIDIKGNTLTEAVEELQEALGKNGQSPINILFAANTGQAGVPHLVLRNVSGPDALRLLATASDCTLEPILSTDPSASAGIIGYQIKAVSKAGSYYYSSTRTSGKSPAPGRSNPRTYDPYSGGGGAPYSAQKKPSQTSGSFSTQIPGSSQSATTRPSKSSSTPKASTQAMSGFGGSGMGVSSFGYSPKPQQPTVRVYALGRITPSVKFEELEDTLFRLLEAAGNKPSDTVISVHEKTNVLIVRGSEEDHRLVADLVDSLEQNQQHTDASELAKTERRYQGAMNELKMIERRNEQRMAEINQERAQAEDEARELAKELRALRDELKSRK